MKQIFAAVALLAVLPLFLGAVTARAEHHSVGKIGIAVGIPYPGAWGSCSPFAVVRPSSREKGLERLSGGRCGNIGAPNSVESLIPYPVPPEHRRYLGHYSIP